MNFVARQKLQYSLKNMLDEGFKLRENGGTSEAAHTIFTFTFIHTMCKTLQNQNTCCIKNVSGVYVLRKTHAARERNYFFWYCLLAGLFLVLYLS